ncbi:hypothetical protein D3C81_1412390 [compost metagenome]
MLLEVVGAVDRGGLVVAGKALQQAFLVDEHVGALAVVQHADLLEVAAVQVRHDQAAQGLQRRRRRKFDVQGFLSAIRVDDGVVGVHWAPLSQLADDQRCQGGGRVQLGVTGALGLLLDAVQVLVVVASAEGLSVFVKSHGECSG